MTSKEELYTTGSSQTTPSTLPKKTSLEAKIQDDHEEKVIVQASSEQIEKGELEPFEIQVPKFLHEKYRFKPKVISHNKIKFLNAQDTKYYQRELKDPELTIWILTTGGIDENNAESKEPKFNYTGKRFFETAWSLNIQVTLVICSRLDLIASQDGLEHILYNGEKIEKLPDAVLPRLGANITYFSLAVVRQLEKMGVLVLNPNNALEVSKDKLYTLQTLAAHNMPIPKTMIAKFPIDPASIERNFSYPMILKKSSGSQGKGVMLIQNLDHLNDVQDMIDVSKPLIFQEYISKSAGRDIRVIVVGGKAIGGMMRVAKKGFKSNFHQGGYVKPVKLTPAVEWLAIESVRLLDLDVAGVDILIDQDTYKICEINSSPGFEGFELATGIDVPAAILDFIRLKCGVWKKNQVTKPAKKAVLIPVSAEHVLPDPIPKNDRPSVASTETTGATNEKQ